MSNVIYAYKKCSSNKIVYVGQTVNLSFRDKQHREYDPFNVNNREYNYPLSRGIRKYGSDEYKLIILEDNVPQDKLNERERYWIDYYDTYWHGYNQTPGGSNPTKLTYTKDIVLLIIEMLQDESFSYADIQAKTGVSFTHISNINQGYRRKQEGLIYPIRKHNTKGTKGLKFTPEECKQIHELILSTDEPFTKIAKQFHCSPDTISKINQGITQGYRLDNYTYPLR